MKPRWAPPRRPRRSLLQESADSPIAFPDDFPDEVLQRIARGLGDAQVLCRLACTCRVFRAIAADETAWAELCERHRVDYYQQLNPKLRKRIQRLQQTPDDSVSSTRASTAKEAYCAWARPRASAPGAAIMRGAFGAVRCVHPRREAKVLAHRWSYRDRSAWNRWPGCALVATITSSGHPAIGPVSVLCSADPAATRTSMNRHMRHHPLRNSVKAGVLSATVKREEGAGCGGVRDAAMLVHAGRTSLAADPRTGRPRGQVVLAVGGSRVFAVAPGGHGANATLLLNIASDAALCAYSSARR
eukprot:COSAG06_NODE_115_length_23358_cov_31.775227_14_plen_301_part_00